MAYLYIIKSMVLRNINKVLIREAEVVQLDQNYKDPMILSSFKFAPITSVDVERSFSIYKHLLTYTAQFYRRKT